MSEDVHPHGNPHNCRCGNEAPPFEVTWEKIKDHEIRADDIFVAPEPLPVERNMPATVVLRPGDKVLVCLVDDPPAEEAQAWARSLHMAFKGVEFVIAGGVAGIAVLGGGDKG